MGSTPWAGNSVRIFGRIDGRARAATISAAVARQQPAQRLQGRHAMTNVPLAGIKACVFDAYGTLFDFAAAARGCRDELGADADKLTALWRDKQLQYTWLRSLSDRYVDFWQVTGDALA